MAHLPSTRLYGLIGYPLTHSFSRKYFSEKFKREGLADCRYELFPLSVCDEITALIAAHPDLKGLNVTIPYKVQVIPYLSQLDEEARLTGAVNTIKIEKGRLTGYNTDVYGFELSLKDFLGKNLAGKQALILGTGGAAKAAAFVLKKLEVPFLFVSRTKQPGKLTYAELTQAIMDNHRLIINATPLGTFPNVETCPTIPYDALGESFYLYDLVYNPATTLFLKKAEARGAQTRNGLQMLHLQAEKAWEIWNLNL